MSNGEEFTQIHVPDGWVNSQHLVDMLKDTAERGEQIGLDRADALLAAIVASQLEVVNAFGVQQAQAAKLKESAQALGNLFKRPTDGK